VEQVFSRGVIFKDSSVKIMQIQNDQTSLGNGNFKWVAIRDVENKIYGYDLFLNEGAEGADIDTDVDDDTTYNSSLIQVDANGSYSTLRIIEV